MPQSTDKPKAENVTISTVRTPKEALRITNKLKAANIESVVADERASIADSSKETGFGGVKIQVPRWEAKRAIHHLQGLQEQSAGEVLPGRASATAGSGVRAWFRVDSWTRAALAVAAILLLTVGLLALYF